MNKAIENGEVSSGGSSGTNTDMSSNMKNFITAVNYNANADGFESPLNADGKSTGKAADDYLANKLRLDTTLTDKEKEKFIDMWGLSDEVLDTVTNSLRYR